MSNRNVLAAELFREGARDYTKETDGLPSCCLAAGTFKSATASIELASAMWDKRLGSRSRALLAHALSYEIWAQLDAKSAALSFHQVQGGGTVKFLKLGQVQERPQAALGCRLDDLIKRIQVSPKELSGDTDRDLRYGVQGSTIHGSPGAQSCRNRRPTSIWMLANGFLAQRVVKET
jgi:hypothetical protein